VDSDSVLILISIIVLLKNSTWKTIRDAVQNTRDIVINLNDGMRFRLVWKKTVYHNPIDGNEYKAQWTTYHPTGGAAPPSDSHVQMKQIILLVQPPEGHIEVKDLTAYMNKVVEVLEKSIPVAPIPNREDGSVGRQIVMEIEIPKCEGWLKVSAYPSMDGLPLQQVLPQIAALAQPRCLSRFKFQMMISLWGYDGPSARFS
jgi:hypothetical protein